MDDDCSFLKKRTKQNNPIRLSPLTSFFPEYSTASLYDNHRERPGDAIESAGTARGIGEKHSTRKHAFIHY